MATRIVFGSYMIRYPLGGMMSHVLQYLVGFRRMGCDVWFVERAHYPNACFDPISNQMGDDASYGMKTVAGLLERFELKDRWCFVDYQGDYYGLTKTGLEDLFATADFFIDMGTHGSLMEMAASSDRRVLIDGEPGFNQIKMVKSAAAGERLPDYDAYFTNGLNVGTAESTAPTAGRRWRHIFHPVVVELFSGIAPPDETAPITTLMNWQSHDPIEYDGRTFGQKDIEFERFINLPERVDSPLLAAIGGSRAPIDRLGQHGWLVEDGHSVSASYDGFRDFIGRSAAEFTVCKNVFVAMRTGWFSDRSAAYLAAGRPVVMQDTGFSGHLPSGEGLFAVKDIDDAAGAIEEIRQRPSRHRKRAREVAEAHLEAKTVLKAFLDEAAADGMPIHAG